MRLARALFSYGGTIDRKSYIGIALIAVLLKQILDRWIAVGLFHREWSVFNYVAPLGTPLRVLELSGSDRNFIVTMVALALPFAWVGTAITVRRFRTIGWPVWLVVLFFVPIANVVSFAIAAAWPERDDVADSALPLWLRRIIPPNPLGAAVFSVLATATLATTLAAFGSMVLRQYGLGLFAAIPFTQGALAAIALGIHGPRPVWQSLQVAILSILVTALALLAFAIEGVVCILMALPLALAFAFLGALLGHCIVHGRPGAPQVAAIVLIMSAPAIMGAEGAVPRAAPVYAAVTAVEVDAPPDVVWRNVVGFPDLAPPDELIFRFGVAYPIRAHISRNGIGATRYCEFSTGTFVEPITAWEPDRRLAFNVVQNPEPMSEWSPYPHLETPHLRGYLVSKRGEFRLEALSHGRTRLIGTTWYQHHLWPSSYWQIYSDAIIHTIHRRVLEHIKHLSERRAAQNA